MRQPDYLVIGGGVIGLCVARSLKSRHRGAQVLLIEKEKSCGQHASGRNSGVLHAGFYYTSDSLKAKWTAGGNRMLQEYCREHRLKLLNCGKLVVTQREDQIPLVNELMQRAKANGVRLEKVTASQARAIEPKVKTHQWALYSPDTAVVDPVEVVQQMFQNAKNEGVQFRFNSSVTKKGAGNEMVFTDGSSLSPGYVINAAGLQADQIARWFGFGKQYRILPFKGLYLKSNYPEHYIRTHIYPLPDIRYPFLGVHFTLQVNGNLKIGPTALPALWREQYGGLSNFNLGEFTSLSLNHLRLLIKSAPEFKKMAILEFKKISKGVMADMAASMLEGVERSHFSKWGLPGIRAQLVDVETMKLVMDFVMEGDGESMHVLNAVSPGFTCALSFSEYICELIEQKQSGL